MRLVDFPNFNPRSREGSDVTVRTPNRTSLHFNPRSREGSDLRSGFIGAPVHRISIHAPVKGATLGPISAAREEVISIHAPVKGATRSPRPQTRNPGHFNPRSREGSDIRHA